MLIALSLALAAVLVICAYVRATRSLSFYADALRQAHVYEDVSLDGVNYTVIDGVVYRDKIRVAGLEQIVPLRLAYEKTLARRNPLMSLAGTNPSDLESALTSLAGEQAELSAIQTSPEHASVVRSALYPMDFLRDLPVLERTRLNFLQSGSENDAHLYEDTLHKAITDYATDIRLFRLAFSRYVPETIRSYSNAGLLISRNQTLEAITTLAQSNKRTQSLYEHRLSCIQGAWKACRDSDLTFPEIATGDGNSATPSQLQTAQEVRRIISVSLSNPALASKTLPLLQLGSAVCTGGTTMPPLFIIAPEQSLVEDATHTNLFLVGDIRLTKTADFPSVPYETFFTKRDIPYIPSNPLLHYECPYMGNDFGNAFALFEVSIAAAKNPASVYATDAQKTALTTLEDSLAPSSRILKETDARSYVRLVESLAQSTDAPQVLRDEAAQLTLLFKDPTAGFAQAITWVAEAEKRNMSAAHAYGVPVDLNPDTLFYFRSGFILFFMGTNSSVTGSTSSYFETVNIPVSAQPFIYYSNLPHTPNATAQFEQYLTTYFDVHRKPPAKNTL